MRQNKCPSLLVSAWCSPVNIFHQFAVELNPSDNQMLLQIFFFCLDQEIFCHSWINFKEKLPAQRVDAPEPTLQTVVLSETTGAIRDPWCYQGPLPASVRLFSSSSNPSMLSCSICWRNLWIFPGLFIPLHVQTSWCSRPAPPTQQDL